MVIRAWCDGCGVELKFGQFGPPTLVKIEHLKLQDIVPFPPHYAWVDIGNKFEFNGPPKGIYHPECVPEGGNS